MAVNVHSALAPVNFMPKVQMFLSKRLVGKEICRTEFKGQLRSGQSIDWPYITRGRVQTYTPGTDLTMDANTATSDTMSINQSKAATFVLDPNQQAQAEDKTINAQLANEQAYVLANDIDQAVLKEGADNAASTITGGVLSASTLYAQMTNATATLQRANANDGELFAVLDPETCALLAQVEVANGFNMADSALSNGFVGKSHAGFYVYSSNNLPTTVTLTMATQPTNLDTITIAGVTWTWVTDGTAAAAGEINIGANIADAKLIFVTAINGTTPPVAGDYIDVSTENRRKYQQAGVAAAAFATNDCVITGFGKLACSETLTDATDNFSAETGSMLFGTKKAISLGMQIEPTMASAPNPNRPMETNYAIHDLYGKKVFYRDVDRLVKMTRTVTASTL
jgi:hypothetical protein